MQPAQCVDDIPGRWSDADPVTAHIAGLPWELWLSPFGRCHVTPPGERVTLCNSTVDVDEWWIRARRFGAKPGDNCRTCCRVLLKLQRGEKLKGAHARFNRKRRTDK